MYNNHDFVQKAILPKEINIVSYQGRCEGKGANIEATLNATIMIKLVKHIINMH